MWRYDIGKPKKVREWNIFTDTVYSDMDLSDCTNSITGRCENVSLEKCIEICEKNPSCTDGYHLSGNGENLCVPMRRDGDLDYIFRIRNKGIYPELNDYETSTFSKSAFPPDKPNCLFFRDYFTLNSYLDKIFIGLSKNDKGIKNTVFSKGGVSLQFLSGNEHRGKLERYSTIKNGERVILNVPDTSLILVEKEGKIFWELKSVNIYSESSIFKVYIWNDEYANREINYNDKIVLKKDDKYLSIGDSDTSILSDEPYPIQITPKIKVYYCGEGECLEVLLEDTSRTGYSATYMGSGVSRSPSCFSLCNGKGRRTGGKKYIFPIIVLLIIFIFLYFLRKSKEGRK